MNVTGARAETTTSGRGTPRNSIASRRSTTSTCDSSATWRRFVPRISVAVLANVVVMLRERMAAASFASPSETAAAVSRTVRGIAPAISPGSRASRPTRIDAATRIARTSAPKAKRAGEGRRGRSMSAGAYPIPAPCYSPAAWRGSLSCRTSWSTRSPRARWSSGRRRSSRSSSRTRSTRGRPASTWRSRGAGSRASRSPTTAAGWTRTTRGWRSSGTRRRRCGRRRTSGGSGASASGARRSRRSRRSRASS